METYQVVLRELNTKKELPLCVQVDEAETTGDIIIKATLEEDEIVTSNYNFLPAFQDFRDKLLLLGNGIKCNGSRINAVQSGMMSCTEKIYLVEMGRHAFMKDIAHIWDYADIEAFPNTNNQTVFFEEWSKR